MYHDEDNFKLWLCMEIRRQGLPRLAYQVAEEFRIVDLYLKELA
jgi:hypothetical protein